MCRCCVFVSDTGFERDVAVELGFMRTSSRWGAFSTVRLGLVGTGGSVGFLEIFIGDSVRFCGSAKFGQFGFYGVRFADWRQNADGGFAGAQLGTETFTVGLVEAEALVVKRA